MSKDQSDKNQEDSRKSKQAIAREERLKQALRVNLHRRKGQARARKPDDAPDNTEAEGT